MIAETAFRLSNHAMKDLLTKSWMTREARWFFSCYKEFGIEKTNKLNLSAIELLAAIETKRMLDALGMVGTVFDSTEKLDRFFRGAKAIAIPEWMDCSITITADNILHWRWNRCFAYDGVKRLGAIDGYRCGVMHRIVSWLNVLNVCYEMRPAIRGCLMHETGECSGEIKFIFDS